MLEQRFSDNDVSKRDIPSFIEPRPPLIQNPFMRPRPQKGTNLLELFEEDSELEEPELVQVYLRMKPCKVPNTLYEVRSDRCLVTSLDTATAGHGRRTQHNVSKMYTFSKIFGAECNQKEIFDDVVKDNLRKLPDGQNFTLLTYGASGSGKTYTLMGTVGAPGLVPRSLEYVFRLVDAAQQPAFRPAESGAEKLSYAEQDYELQWVKRLRHISAPLRDKYRRMSVQLHNDLTVSSMDLTNRIRHYVWVSFVEIYNEAVYDLLAPPEKRTKLRIREDTSGNVYVKGATQAFVRSGEEAYDVMVAGKHNLVVAATGVHAHSSRSHCIFTITMLTETGDGLARSSYVRLCDLAGCERARATRNTGTRMAESRAINSSLHVLERCLHMLRRKQKTKHDAMVPYRESKLTRLLGSGLSGARGEAVSMVVTLNPSPEYAHETKHVLTLAAVAQDIQINNTIYSSVLESSTQETTISCSTEAMKLRSDNERLHFELVRAQACNRELMAAMEERQQENANTMRELVEEAKDLTKQYYEARLEALRREMEDVVEEYESRLANVAAQATGASTPSRFLQDKVTQLMTEIAMLEEKLTAERLARSRAEKEVQHLRTCIEERDEKAFKDTTPPREDVVSLSESEPESDEETSDPFNESLEPIFKKELNRSIAIQNDKRDSTSVHTIDNIDEECDTDLDKTHDTLKNDEDSKNSADAIGEDEANDSSEKIDENNDNVADGNSRFDESVKNDTNLMHEILENYGNMTYGSEITHNKYDDCMKNYETMTHDSASTHNEYDESLNNYTRDISYDEVNYLGVDKDIKFKNESIKSSKLDSRGTYFITDTKVTDNSDYIENDKEKKINSLRGTYFVKDPLTDVSKCEPNKKEAITEIFQQPINRDKSKIDIKVTEKLADALVNKLISEKPNFDKNIQENLPENLVGQIVREKSNVDIKVPGNISENIMSEIRRVKSNVDITVPEKKSLALVSNIQRKKSNVDRKELEKASESIVGKISKKSNVDVTATQKVSGPLPSTIMRESSNVDMNMPENLLENEVSRIMMEKTNVDIKVPAKVSVPLVSKIIREKSNVNIKVPEKVSETLVNKVIRSFKSNHGSDSSLRQFEQLEKASKERKHDFGQNESVFGEIKILKEKRTYFDNVSSNNNAPKANRTYFDNIGVNVEVSNKRLNEVINDEDERSPSIVKDITSDHFEPSTIKKLVSESFTKPDVISSIHKTRLTKKLNSMDIFDGFDSPIAPKTKENVDNIEIARQSIEKLVLSQQSTKKSVNADMEPRLSIREDLKSVHEEVPIDIKKEMKLEPMSSVEEFSETKEEFKKETKLEPVSSIDETHETMNEVHVNDKKDNTIDEFENIYKDVSAPRVTEFDLLASQIRNESTDKNYQEKRYNLRKTHCKTDTKVYHQIKDEEIIAENQVKCESKVRKRPLRLRRKRNQDDDSDDKLKDIGNLQSEFSDVTLDVPAPQKQVKDIPSPEKGREENLPPLIGIQSCPSKSVTRSRRKLFTPRAEPLEESLSQTGDSNERVYVPRPSYRRPRARRKL